MPPSLARSAWLPDRTCRIRRERRCWCGPGVVSDPSPSAATSDARGYASGGIAMRERTPVYTTRLQSVECGRVSREGERGWRAYLTVEDDDEPAEAVVLPPALRRERIRKPGSVEG